MKKRKSSKKRQINKGKVGESRKDIYHHEDVALKTSVKFFADELLPYLDIEGKVVAIAPTESIHLELKKFYEDFNFVMDNGSWKHFEFQSKEVKLEDMKRFRAYEAVESYQNHVEVTTYVLCSGKIKNPITEYTEGINTYRVVPIILRDHKVEELFEKLREKQEQGQILTKEDLVPLTLCLLMGGEMEQKERVQSVFCITRKANDVEKNIIQMIESVVYMMADKFLEEDEMKELREEIRMTRLGQILVEDGIKEGREKEKLEIAHNLLDILDIGTISERLGLPLEEVQRLKEEL